MCMSPKGNDLVRRYLWNAARVGIRFNPALRALYARLKAKGKRGDVAIGHCMRKLLHLVFAVWKTNRPFDENYFPWEPSDTAGVTDCCHRTTVPAAARRRCQRKSRGPQTGRSRSKSGRHGYFHVAPTPATVNRQPAKPNNRPAVDFAFLRSK